MGVKVTVLYDNEAEDGFISGWGFSCLIQHQGRTILFDTGWDGADLLKNMKSMKIEKGSIDTIILSHDHWDHIGGLTQVLHPGATVYLPASFSNRLKNEISTKAGIREVEGPIKIMEGVYLTGELGEDIKEQSIVLETGNGLFVITGCAHPGLDVILSSAVKMGSVAGVMGGFHGFDNLDLLSGLSLIVPCHCTRRKREILERFTETSKRCFAGLQFQLEQDHDHSGIGE